MTTRKPILLILVLLTTSLCVARGSDNQLANPGFELAPLKTGWTTVGNTPVYTVGTTTYYNQGVCPPDKIADLVTSHSGSNVANIYGNFNAPTNVSSWSQDIAATPGSTWSAGGWTYASHEDLMTGSNYFYYEVDFLTPSGTLLASYESPIITNLICGGPNLFPLDTWIFLPVTNQMQVTNGVNTGLVISNTALSGTMTAPANTASLRFQAIFVNINYAGGSIFLDDCTLYSGILPPSLSAISPNGILLCTNTAVTCTATSPGGTITNVQVVIQTYGLTGGTNTVTNNLTSTTSGIGTSTANISYTLTPNLVYNVTVVATDNNGNSTSAAANFDTFSPTLVIEAEDFNFSGGQFIDTPANGGLALYLDRIGEQSIDENKNTASTSTKSYYRPSDAVVIQPAAPLNGTEQKYWTAAAQGDTTDVPLEVGYTSVGDWLNYTRTFPAGTYFVWSRLATVGSGGVLNFYQITSNPTQQNQSSNLLGSFSFSDNGWNTYEYVPLLDQFGNLASVNLSGQETLRTAVTGIPNMDFFMFMPAPSITVASPTASPSSTVFAGTTVTLTVKVLGAAPFRYQWQSNHVNIPGATNANFVLTNAPVAVSGTYDVIVSNAFGSTNSPPLVLTVTGGPSVISFMTNGSNWTVNQSGLTSARIADGVFYGTDGGFNEAVTAWYNIPVFINGFTATFTYRDVGGSPGYNADGLSFTLQQSGPTQLGSSGGNLAVNGLIPSVNYELNLYDPNGIGIVCHTDGFTGGYQPTGAVNVSSGDPIDFTIVYSAGGQVQETLLDTVTGDAYATNYMIGDIVQLLGNTVAYIGFTSSDGGTASIQTISNFIFQSTSGAPSPTAPEASPSSTVFASSTVSFTEEASGSPPFQYQWLSNSVPLAGATGSTLVLSNVAVADSATYQVIVSNSYGTSNSPVLVFTVKPPSAPFFTSEPTPASAMSYAAGTVIFSAPPGILPSWLAPSFQQLLGPVSFSAAADGSPPISLQWQLNGANVTGQTNSSLTLTNLQTNQAGIYTLVASNAYGLTTSSPVTVAVLLPNLNPSIALFTNAIMVGQNLDSIDDWSTAWPFLDVFKTTRPWITANADGSGPWDTGLESAIPSDTNGWPTHVPFLVNGTNQLVKTIITDLNESGTYTFSFEGTGTAALSLSWIEGAAYGGSYIPVTATGGVQSVSFTTPISGAQIIVQINTSATNDYMRNFHIVLTNYLATYQTQPFHPLFLQRLQPFGCLRFMDWGQVVDSPLMYWTNRTTPASYTQQSPNGVALEYMAQLCNTLQANAWISIPAMVDDDYVQQAAQLLYHTLNPNLRLYVEYSNETWNGDYSESSYVQTQGLRLGLNSDPFTAGEYYVARRSAQIWNFFEQVFGSASASRLVKVISTQTGNYGVDYDRIAGLLNPSVNLTGVMPDALAIAPYFGANVADTNTVDDILTNLAPQAIASYPSVIGVEKSIADAFGWWLVCYEGGQSFGGGDFASDTNVTAICEAANRDPRMGALYTQYLDMLQAQGVNLFNHFDYCSAWGGYGSWGALEYQDQPTNEAPKYVSLVEWVAANRFALAPPSVSVSNLHIFGSQGATVTLAAVINGGTPPFSYQWYDIDQNGNTDLVAGQTNLTLTLTDVGQGANSAQACDCLQYFLVAINTNGLGSTVPATLTVGQATPQITIQPTNQSVIQGGSASFSVGATGSAPLVYQWQFDGANLQGATNTYLVFNAVAATNAGNYDIIVTNTSGSVTSAIATLSVLGVPVAFVVNSGGIQFSNGQLQLALSGLSGQGSVVIEASTNLTRWTPIFTNPPGFGTIQIVDPSASNNPFRYYRAQVH